MQKKEFITKGTCAKKISFEYDDNMIMHNLQFENGCPGNLKAISKLCENRSLSEIYSLLNGNTCGVKTTSCCDQLAKAIKEVL